MNTLQNVNSRNDLPSRKHLLSSCIPKMYSRASIGIFLTLPKITFLLQKNNFYLHQSNGRVHSRNISYYNSVLIAIVIKIDCYINLLGLEIDCYNTPSNNCYINWMLSDQLGLETEQSNQYISLNNLMYMPIWCICQNYYNIVMYMPILFMSTISIHQS